MSSPQSNPEPVDPEDVFGPAIHSYSRAEALADGLLIDVTSTAREAGFLIPVALTRAVWESYVAVPPKVVAQDEPGRLWDILWMASLAARRNRDAGEVRFTVSVRNDNRQPRPRTLRCTVGSGDQGEAVITILLPEED
ncbi:MAG TPA: DUF6573 family protein [Thermoanaerobaculia bacterium]|nr:DUF6573 family protein [Thermoanaerobaculia bacterium]